MKIYFFLITSLFFSPAIAKKNSSLSAATESIEVRRDKLRKILNSQSDSSSKDIALVQADERDYNQINLELLEKFRLSLRHQKFKSFKNFLTEEFSLYFYKRDEKKHTLQNKITISPWKIKKSPSSELTKYISGLDEIVDLSFSYIEVKVLKRTKEGATSQAHLKSIFDLRAIKNQTRIHDRGEVIFHVKNINNKWKINSLLFTAGKSLHKKQASFKKVTLNLKNKKSSRDHIRCAQENLNIADFNNDKKQDILVSTKDYQAIFQGDGQGQFTLFKENSLTKNIKKTLFYNADFNNDGLEDILSIEPGRIISIYQNKGAMKFTKKSSIKLPKSDIAHPPITIADFNNDKLLDFFVAQPFFIPISLDPQASPNIETSPSPPGLYINRKNFTFRHKQNNKTPLIKKRYDTMLPAQVLTADIDTDGDQDIFLTDENGTLFFAYRNNDNGVLQPIFKKIHISQDEYATKTIIKDLNQDGKLDIVYAQTNFVPSQRLFNSGIINHDYQYAQVKGKKGVHLFTGSANFKFSNSTETSFDFHTGEGVAGVDLLDYNNDGYLDVYVSNGLWSGNLPTNDITSLFVQADTSNISVHMNKDQEKSSTPPSPFLFFLNEAPEDSKTKKNTIKKSSSLAGHQRNRLYLNNKNQTFTEVGFLEGVDSPIDGHLVKAIDINNDHKTDLILKNCTQNQKEVLFVYLNN
ncbi:MAG: VCBS repeat-containing protein [Halobacteriovoraceae bacterium]|nr:VCBS repeat-containing protein [Halobacteriovoraceae bacterium]